MKVDIMAISLQTDSDGNSYQVWAQQQTSSCVIASIWMARSIARQTTFAEDEWELAHRLYHSAIAGRDADDSIGPQTFDPRSHSADQTTMGNTFSRFGVTPSQIASMMRQEGFVVSSQNVTTLNTAAIGPTKPALVGIKWRNSASGPNLGGHRIVAVAKNSNAQIVYLDPGFGGRLLELPNDGVIPHPNRSVSGYVYNAIYIRGGNIPASS